MPRRRKYRPEPQDEPGLDISSLIDVSFLLLIYFLITSTLQDQESDLDIVLPTQLPNDNPDPLDPVAIRVKTDGGILYDKEEIIGPNDPTKANTLPALYDKLKQYKDLADAAGDSPMVIIAADDDGKTQRFIDVVNVLAKAGISTITMTGFRDDE